MNDGNFIFIVLEHVPPRNDISQEGIEVAVTQKSLLNAATDGNMIIDPGHEYAAEQLGMNAKDKETRASQDDGTTKTENAAIVQKNEEPKHDEERTGISMDVEETGISSLSPDFKYETYSHGWYCHFTKNAIINKTFAFQI
jgi:hypothetical protein